MKLCIVGTGYVGLVSGVCFADLGNIVYCVDNDIQKIKFLNKEIPNPIGIAAGFDKNAEVYNSLFKLGFGFVEVGTITPLKQYGNPKPRVFRLVEDKALIN